ncbi:VPLPA-CTERM sorting domain-containing protein [Frigidibacter sp. ROC022]|uniref:VPLPA-CTERM sorting domain-containing protein n=1 Tax=Frigidibacter sp. ROC022 TaxID=2971796 RepID=UPI00215AE213|nr:VPLPA-CTERM sorting domain-containing protein [Frigidibacter sp. ROC022]MCR8725240.1 VPLPA-CTERM sorting domain-containing protein [Frigidibacter sp. ROC022]
MNIKAWHAAAGLFAAAAGGANAATTTYDFGNPDTGPFSASCSVAGIVNANCSVTQTSNGLGVDGNPDLIDPDQIDGFPVFSAETLTITFNYAVNLVEFTLGLLDGYDDYELSINGGSFSHFGPGVSNPIVVGQNYVSSFSIRASGELKKEDWYVGNDAFTLRSMTVASVPLPAGGLLLVGALGGLGALRRRKAKKAA